jgi:2-deoxy-D-gluconate 3-dehydrogenase
MLKRWGDPADILGSIIFLSSDASKYITGIDLTVDGGWLSNGL